MLLGPISFGPHNSANRYVFVLVVHEDLALRFNNQIAAGQHCDHLRCHAGLERRA